MKILKIWWVHLVSYFLRNVSSVPAEVEPVEPVESIRKPRVNRRKTLANLLESLEHIEPLLMCKTLYAQNTAKTRSALMKVGPYILDPSSEAEGISHDTVNAHALSTIMFVGLGRHAEADKDKWLPGEFVYAIKSPTKRNPYVSHPTRPHVAIYECGRAVYDYKPNKLIWDMFYVAVGEDGKPEALLKRTHERVDVGGGSFVRVAWQEHDFADVKDG
jgi:hypothetical protein